MREILAIGFEKIIVNSSAWTDKSLVPTISKYFGSSTVVGSIDVKTNWFGRERVYIHGGSESISLDPVSWARELETRGVGEIMINSIDRDGEMTGYDIDLIKRVAGAVTVPVIAAGWGWFSARSYNCHIRGWCIGRCCRIDVCISRGRHRAVLISYPSITERKDASQD